MKKLVSKMTLTLVLAIVMGITVVAPALAEEPAESSTPAATIEKVLTAPEGTVLPEGLSFTFKVDQVFGSTVTPAPADISLDMTDSSAQATVEAGALTVTAKSANLLDSMSFPNAGLYIFEVTEIASATSEVDGTIDFDTGSWLLFVQVANTEGGTEIRTVIMGRSAVNESGDLVLDELGRPTATAKDSGSMLFENIFVPSDIGTLENSALTISKTAIGDYANLSHPFSFNLALSAPVVPAGTTLTGPIWARIVDIRGESETVVGEPIDLLTTSNFTLAHGHELRVTSLPVGTAFVVTETGTSEYVPSATVIAGSATGSYAAEVGADLSTSSYRISNADAGNNAAFTNTHQETTFTGLDLAAMPLVVVLVLATVLLAMMVASRARRRIEELPPV
jgi:hypothetical protein